MSKARRPGGSIDLLASNDLDKVPAFELRPVEGKTDVDLIPEFEVFDDSKITIKEASTELEKSMVNNSFSSTSLKMGG